MIPAETIAELRQRIDMVALIGEHVALKKLGQSYRGLCPFHSEKSPSFYVHPERGFFHCFGCGASGDVLSFTMRLSGSSFPEAARQLADRAGMVLPDENSPEVAAARRAEQRRSTLFDVMERATAFFEKYLQRPDAQAAGQMLQQRGITQEIAAAFRLGYAPDSWDALVGALAKHDVASQDAEAVGLLVPRRNAQVGRAHYDRFRHRLMFPVIDTHGRVVAFSGRALPSATPQDHDKSPPAKYINSPETALYKKGTMLFGLYQARLTMRQRDEVVICEGNFDVLALHQAGVTHTVAPLGTALTKEQCQLLRRFAQHAVIIFDADEAGEKATTAAFPLLRQAGIVPKVATLPSGHDPDSFLREHGASALTQLIANALGMMEYLIDRAAEQAGADAQRKASAIERLGGMLVMLENPVEIDFYIDRIAQRFGVRDLRSLRQTLRVGARKFKQGQKNANTQSLNLQKSGQKRPDSSHRIELEMLGILLDQPGVLARPVVKRFAELLTDGDLRTMLCEIESMIQKSQQNQGQASIQGGALVEQLADNSWKPWLVARLAQQTYDVDEATKAFQRGLILLAKQHIERGLPNLSRQIQAARQQGDEEKAKDLTRQHMELFRSARAVIADTAER